MKVVVHQPTSVSALMWHKKWIDIMGGCIELHPAPRDGSKIGTRLARKSHSCFEESEISKCIVISFSGGIDAGLFCGHEEDEIQNCKPGIYSLTPEEMMSCNMQ
jgi:hypothetical protein